MLGNCKINLFSKAFCLYLTSTSKAFCVYPSSCDLRSCHSALYFCRCSATTPDLCRSLARTHDLLWAYGPTFAGALRRLLTFLGASRRHLKLKKIKKSPLAQTRVKPLPPIRPPPTRNFLKKDLKSSTFARRNIITTCALWTTLHGSLYNRGVYK